MPSLDAHDALLKESSRSAPPVLGDRLSCLAVAACTDDPDDDDEDWDLEDAFALEEVEYRNAERRSRDIQNRCIAKKSKGPGTVAEPIKLASEFGNQVAAADAVPSTKLIFIMGALAVALSEAKKPQNRLAVVHKKHKTLKGDF